MPLPEEVINLFNSVIQTEEDKAAFEAGFQLSLDPVNRARLDGPVVIGNGDGISVDLKMVWQEGTWVADRELPRHGNHVIVSSAPFVLGAVAAAIGNKHDRSQVELPSTGDSTT